jgi:hypothetical protein
MAKSNPDKAVKALRKWLRQSNWVEEYESFVDEFFGFLRTFGQRSLNEVDQMLSRTVTDIARDVCYEEFLVLDFTQRRRVISSFLSESTQRYSDDELDYLFNLCDTKASLYEVVDIHSEHEVTLKDLLMRGDTFEYVGHGSSRPLEVGDILLARIIEKDEDYMLTAGVVVLARDVAMSLVQSVEAMVTDAQEELQGEYACLNVPRIVAFEDVLPIVPRLAINGWLLDCADTVEHADTIMVQGGSELRLVTLSYPIRTDFSVLKKTLDKQKWLQPAPEVEGWIVVNPSDPTSNVDGNLSIEGRRLIAFAMSEEIGAVLQDRIEAAVGGMLGIPSIDRILPSELMRVMASNERPAPKNQESNSENDAEN